MVGHEALRRIDRWLGAPVCAALSGMRRIARWWGGGAPGREQVARRVPFVQLAESGSRVLAPIRRCGR